MIPVQLRDGKKRYSPDNGSAKRCGLLAAIGMGISVLALSGCSVLMHLDAELPVPGTQDKVRVEKVGLLDDFQFRLTYMGNGFSRSLYFKRWGSPGGLGTIYVLNRGDKSLFLMPHGDLWRRCVVVDRKRREMNEYDLCGGESGATVPESGVVVCGRVLDKPEFLRAPPRGCALGGQTRVMEVHGR